MAGWTSRVSPMTSGEKRGNAQISNPWPTTWLDRASATNGVQSTGITTSPSATAAPTRTGSAAADERTGEGPADPKSVVVGQRGYVRGSLGGRRIHKNKKN